VIDGILAYGILWLDWEREHAIRRAVAGLRLFVPAGTSRSLRERVLALSSSARVEIYEWREPDGPMKKMDPADGGNLESRLVPRREVETILDDSRNTVAQVRSLVPSASAAIETRVTSGAAELAICFRGLEFARWNAQGASFGLGDIRENLSAAMIPRLTRLIRNLERCRKPQTEKTNHALYRAVPERWLETLILEDSSRLDAHLDAKHLYSQVPALAAGDRGVIDLLGVTTRGRLVVIELKASEDIQLPIQAVDYWLRVRRHQQEGNFQRHGYFAGIELDEKPPMVWLVAPGLRFHSAIEKLLKYLSPGIQITRIGLNENWRRGMEVVFRQ
jgi:hypothetical protein